MNISNSNTEYLASQYRKFQEKFISEHHEADCILLQAIFDAAQKLLDMADFKAFLKLTGPTDSTETFIYRRKK